MRLIVLLCLSLIGHASSPSSAAEPSEVKIVKTLRHLLDKQGRHTISPSLLDRDAYQAFLRDHPENVTGLRFDVQWRREKRDMGNLKLRVEIRHGSGSTIENVTQTVAIETPSRRRSQWQQIAITGDAYRALHEVIAWRVSIWQEGAELASQESFLW